MGSFEIIEHTADVGIRAKGESLPDCFAAAGRGMMHIVTDLEAVNESRSYPLQIKTDDLERLLFGFLSDVLYLHHVETFLFSEFSLELEEGNNHFSLTGEGRGEEFDPKKHEWRQEVKAVTFHELLVETHPHYNVEVLFDI